jgi:hypothetical protein
MEKPIHIIVAQLSSFSLLYLLLDLSGFLRIKQFHKTWFFFWTFIDHEKGLTSKHRTAHVNSFGRQKNHHMTSQWTEQGYSVRLQATIPSE